MLSVQVNALCALLSVVVVLAGVQVQVASSSSSPRASVPRRALIIIDVQNCFTYGGSLAVPDAEEVFPVINRLRNDAPWDLIVRTKVGGKIPNFVVDVSYRLF
jgi:hypothetical protein